MTSTKTGSSLISPNSYNSSEKFRRWISHITGLSLSAIITANEHNYERFSLSDPDIMAICMKSNKGVSDAIRVMEQHLGDHRDAYCVIFLARAKSSESGSVVMVEKTVLDIAINDNKILSNVTVKPVSPDELMQIQGYDDSSTVETIPDNSYLSVWNCLKKGPQVYMITSDSQAPERLARITHQ